MTEIDDDKEIQWVEVRLSAERTKRAYAMRKGEAKLQSTLTDAMVDARNEIETAWNFRVQGMGYATIDPARSRGQNHMGPEAIMRMQELLGYLNTWQRECHRPWRKAVISFILYTGMTVKEIAELEGMHRTTLTDHYRRGLNDYCKQRGWGEQINFI
jgi:hypothetical protein